jgi:hypothetical protein
MAREATRHYQQDQRAGDAPMRMRFGVYYYAEPLPEGERDPPAHAPVLAQRRKTAARKAPAADKTAARKSGAR